MSHHVLITTMLQLILHAVSKPSFLRLYFIITFFLLFIECSICGDPGLAPNDDCSGCVVTDICLANNPCRNNGNCTLNGGPNSYTCECPPEFTGTNCDVGKYYRYR